MKTSYSFLTIGKTQESSDNFSNKLYVGLASSFVLGVNPDKKTMEQWLGHEVANEPTYTNEQDSVGNIRISFFIKTDPSVNKVNGKGVEIINQHTFFLRNQPAISQDQQWATVIDKFGNSTITSYEIAKVNGKITNKDGSPAKIAPDYRIAYDGEANLVAFLKAYLGVHDAFNYANGTWSLKTEDLDSYLFSLEHIQDYFKGDVSEIREALALQPNNKVKLLYGTRTTEKGTFQCTATERDLVLTNNTGRNAENNLAKHLAYLNTHGNWATKFHYEVCTLKEYNIVPTDFTQTPSSITSASSADEMPW